MGIFKNLSRLIKANINDAISKAEDPQKILNQAIIEMNEQLIESKKAVAGAIADEKKLQRQMNEQLAQAKDWENKAVLALRSSREDLAREALVRQQEYQKIGGEYKTQWEAQHAMVEKLKSSLRELQNKIDEAQRKKNLLVARAKRAEAQKQISQTMSSMGNSSAFDAFERMSAKVDKIEAEADALGDLNSLEGDSSLESEFKALESGAGNTDLLLEQLKARMGEGS